ncbi:unnamed protein product [Cunninghamella blakesleeana]
MNNSSIYTYNSLRLAENEDLLQRKQEIQSLLAAPTSSPVCKLVYNINMLKGFNEDEMKPSYTVLWSDYTLAEQNPKVKVFELNLRIYDLVLRIELLYQLYSDYINRNLSNLNKKNFSGWLYDDLKLGPSFRGEKVCASKKSIMKSLPIMDEPRARILEFINKYGVEMIAFTEFVNLGRIATLSLSDYQTLCEVLDSNMETINDRKSTSTIQDIFKVDSSITTGKGTIISKK